MKTLGQINYEVYQKYLGLTVTWNDLQDKERAAWERAAQDTRSVAQGDASQLNTSVSIAEWQTEVHETAKSKGWWEKPRTFGDVCMLFTSEVAEAFEEFRNGHSPTEIYLGDKGKPEGIPVELADLVIRVLDYCGFEGIDLEAAIAQKHAFNATRPHRHGGKTV